MISLRGNPLSQASLLRKEAKTVNNLNSIKQILRATPPNMRRLVNALHSEGFTVRKAHLNEDGVPEITVGIHSESLLDGSTLKNTLFRWGVCDTTAKDLAMNVSYLLDVNGTLSDGFIRLHAYTDDDFTALPPLTIDCSFTPAQIEAAARAAHEVNRSYCEAGGDTSQKSWAEAPNWQCQSALEGVRAVIEGKTPDQLHESWVQAKVADGWRYGEVKDAEAKTHPCIVQYTELPEFQQRKDEIFRSTVCAVLGIELT